VAGSQQGDTVRFALVLATNAGGQWTVPAVASLVADGHHVHCFLAAEPGTLGERFLEVGATVSYHTMDKGTAAAVVRDLPAFLREVRAFRPDAIIYYLYKSAILGRLARVVAANCPTVHVTVGPAYLELAPVRMAERVLHHMDTQLVYGSHHIRARYEALGRTSNSDVIYPPIRTDALLPATPEQRALARQRLGIEDAEFVLVMLAYWYAPKLGTGRERHLKGHDLVIKAWREYRERGGRGRLLIVGGGFRDVGARYRQATLLELGDFIDESVTVIGEIQDPRSYYWAADASIAASSTENLGSSAEAASFCVPSIGVCVGGIPEIVVDGYSGILARRRTVHDLALAIEEMANLDAAERAAMGSRARMMAVSQLGERHVVERLVETIYGVVAGGKATR
jgi:glycosyltransferase involved in cell wall biosynthesis